jgi:hypothetical protein
LQLLFVIYIFGMLIVYPPPSTHTPNAYMLL